MRLLGLDYGLKRIGYALCDTETRLAIPLGIIEAEKNPLKTIQRIIQEDGVEAIVLGIPNPTHAAQGQKQAQLTEAFLHALTSAVTVPIFTVNEENTSSEARRLIKEEGATHPIDALAAMLILEDYLAQNP